jgi:uncharacterized protein YdaT
LNKIELTKEKEAEIAEAQAYEEYAASEHAEQHDEEQAVPGSSSRGKNKQKKRLAIDKQEAFMEFKSMADGKELEESIRDNRVELKKIKNQVRELTE